jgi:uncharacterized protein (DUF2062 family)
MALIIYQKIRQNILIPLKIIPKHGLSDENLSLSITLGIIAGVFPVLGGTTVIGFVFLAAMRQNLATVQAINWLLAPIQLLTIIPFIRLGTSILQKIPARITLTQLVQAFEPGLWTGLKNLGQLHLYGVMAWGMIALPTGFALYYLLLALFRYISKRGLQSRKEISELV